jgi:hypothetical protein
VGRAGFEREGDDEGVADGRRLALGSRLLDGSGPGRLVEEDSGFAPCAVPSAVIGSARGGS